MIWQALYTAAHRLRARWYETRARELPRPVISIGNLHWGGTGKTPLTAAVAAWLRDRGRRVTILSRGYGREKKGVRVVSRGEGPLLGPRAAGDEPVWLAGQLPGVAVVVSADRHKGGLHALERLDPPPDLFLLDDGFSHLALARDLDLLVLPAADPLGGGKLPPGGRLREPLVSSRRAHGLLVTGREASGRGREAAQALRPHGFQGPGFDAPIRVEPPRRLDGSPLDSGARVLLVSAIARPERFAESVRELDLEIAGELRYRDHHRYPRKSLDEIAEAFEAGGAQAVLATSKDRVKLQGRLDVPLAELPIRAEPEPAFWEWLEANLP